MLLNVSARDLVISMPFEYFAPDTFELLSVVCIELLERCEYCLTLSGRDDPMDMKATTDIAKSPVRVVIRAVAALSQLAQEADGVSLVMCSIRLAQWKVTSPCPVRALVRLACPVRAPNSFLSHAR